MASRMQHKAATPCLDEALVRRWYAEGVRSGCDRGYDVSEQEPTTGARQPGASPATHRQPPAFHRGNPRNDSLKRTTSRSLRSRLDASSESDVPADVAASERALGNLLTVIKAEAQLLERSVRRADRHQPEQTGARLAAIVTKVDQAALELYRLARLRAQSSKRRSG